MGIQIVSHFYFSKNVDAISFMDNTWLIILISWGPVIYSIIIYCKSYYKCFLNLVMNCQIVLPKGCTFYIPVKNVGQLQLRHIWLFVFWMHNHVWLQFSFVFIQKFICSLAICLFWVSVQVFCIILMSHLSRIFQDFWHKIFSNTQWKQKHGTSQAVQ